MKIVICILFIYIGIGIYFLREIINIAKAVPKGDKSYCSSREVLDNLSDFVGFSLSIFKWPKLIYIVYFAKQ